MYNGFGAYPSDDMDMGVNSYFGESDTNFFGDTSNDSFFGEGVEFIFDSSDSFFGESAECFVESDDNKKGKWDGKFSDDPELNAAKAKMDHHDLDDGPDGRPFTPTRDSTRKARNRIQRLNYADPDAHFDDAAEAIAGVGMGYHSKKGTPYWHGGIGGEEFQRDQEGVWKRKKAVDEIKNKGNKK